MKPDFGATAHDYGTYRVGFPDSFFDRLTRIGVLEEGMRVLDLGTGTGSLARGFAKRGCRAVGIDPAAPMLDQARALDAEAGVEVEYKLAKAEDTGFEDASFDLVSAGQCWHWFDRAKATLEAARVLRPDGALLIAHLDWIPLSGNLVEATEKLIEGHNPDWKVSGGMGLHPWWLRGLRESAFRGIETFSYDIEVPYSPEAWRGRLHACAGIGASLSEAKVGAFDIDLERLLAERFPGAVLQVPHCVFAIIARAPAPT